MSIKHIMHIILLLSIALILVSGCRQQNTLSTSQSNSIYISSASTSIGADEKDGVINEDEQVLTYSFSITNETNNKLYVSSFKPIFESNFAKRVISKDIEVKVQKEILPNSSITIDGGKIKFDSKGMTKEQITKLSPYITDIKVNYEQTLGFAKKIS